MIAISVQACRDGDRGDQDLLGGGAGGQDGGQRLAEPAAAGRGGADGGQARHPQHQVSCH